MSRDVGAWLDRLAVDEVAVTDRPSDQKINGLGWALSAGTQCRGGCNVAAVAVQAEY
jgi:hypothetical protein